MENEMNLEFGDYCSIEQKRFGVPNQMYQHKVVGRLKSNTWVDVPVQTPARETNHDTMCEVVACICCGVSEDEVLKFRVSDVRKETNSPKSQLQAENTALREALKRIADKCGSEQTALGYHIEEMAQTALNS